MRFKNIFLVFILAELASYAGYFFPWLNTVGFFVIVGTALVLLLRRLEYGPYFVLADLILGGKSGALFSFEYGEFFLSLRMGLFLVVMAVWIGKMIGDRTYRSDRSYRSNPILKWWGVFGLAVGWGIAVGLVRGNNFGDLFLDANGYLYGVMVLPFLWTTKYEFDTNIRKLGIVFFAATTLLALKTLFAVYWFTHAGNNFIAGNLVPFYQWIRDTGVGEITWLEGNFARVFFQSQVFNIAAFFVLLASAKDPSTSLGMTRLKRYTFLALNAAVILVSFSRSFWVGVTVGLAAFVISPIGPISPVRLLGQIGRIGKPVLGSVILAVLLILAVARFPFPPPSPADFGAAARERLAAEAAATSRWNLLPAMWRAIREHPVLGSGFGRTVTYISNDPRIREVSPTGEYTTYAFEWGWLDIWLKMGALGLIGPAGLIFAFARRLRRTYLAGFAVLAVLASIHIFTPYLNHPLGLGMLILLMIPALQLDKKASAIRLALE